MLQVLDNLLGNARKFARTRVTIGAKLQSSEVLFWVSDDGRGIAPEDLPHVFERFAAAGSANEKAQRGDVVNRV